jgi:putative membrane protein
LSKLIIRLLINAAAVWVAWRLVPGISVENPWPTLAIVALIIGVINALIRPALKLLTCPLIIVTLGLFTLVINALMLLLTSWIAGQLQVGFNVADFVSAFWGGLVISVVSFVLSLVLVEKDDKRQRRERER